MTGKADFTPEEWETVLQGPPTLLELRLGFWLRGGLGSDIRACACN
jgi:hypothetical protein